MYSLVHRRLRRLPFLWWLCAIAVAVLTGVLVTSTVSKAQASAERFEGLASVYVTVKPVAAGEVIESSSVRKTTWPRAFLPAGHVSDDPIGQRAHVPVLEGEPLTEAKLSATGGGPAATQLRSDERGIAVPTNEMTPAVRAGDYVDVLVTLEVAGAHGDPTSVVASRARVLDIGEDAMTLAVHETEATRVAFALVRGDVLVALSAP